MKLFKWTTGLKPKFPGIIEKFFGRKITDGVAQGEEVSTIPSVNISVVNKAFDVNIALPGLDKKDVKIEVLNNCLIISSEKQYEKEDMKKNWIRREYGYASFQRMFELPEGADPDKVKAEMKNGVLSVSIPKKKGYQSIVKQIAVN